METTLDYAEAHFTQLFSLVAKGEEVVLHRGTVPVEDRADSIGADCEAPCRGIDFRACALVGGVICTAG